MKYWVKLDDKKFKGKKFIGRYVWSHLNGGPHEGLLERTFVLFEKRKDKRKPRAISFESYQQAKKQGWQKTSLNWGKDAF